MPPPKVNLMPVSDYAIATNCKIGCNTSDDSLSLPYVGVMYVASADVEDCE